MGYNLSGSIGITGSLVTSQTVSASDGFIVGAGGEIKMLQPGSGFGDFIIKRNNYEIIFTGSEGNNNAAPNYRFVTGDTASPNLTGAGGSAFMINECRVGINTTVAQRTASLTVVGDVEIIDNGSPHFFGSGSLFVQNHITASGNISSSGTGSFAMIGIGTATPTAKLDIDGEVSIGGGEAADEARLTFRASDESKRFTIETDLSTTTSNDLLGFRSTTTDNILVLNGNGKVGIGINNPTNELVVKSSTDTSVIQISDDDTDAFLISKDDKFSIGSSNTDTDLFFVDLANDRVGIGPGTPGVRFHMFGASTSNTTLKIEGTNTAARPKIILGTLRPSGTVGTHTIASVDSGGANGGEILQINTDEVFQVQTNAVTRLHLDQSLGNGRLGINTTTPESILHLLSSGSDTGLIIQSDTANDPAGESKNPYIRLSQDGSNPITHGIIGLSGGNNVWPNGGSNVGGINNSLIIGFSGSASTGTNHNIQLLTNNTARLSISSSGNVGIGTITPEEKLHVEDGIIFTNKKYFEAKPISYAADQDNWALRLGAHDNVNFDDFGIKFKSTTGGSAYLSFRTYGGDDRMVIRNGGNIGIGTNDPTARLNIHETTGTAAGANGTGTLTLSHGNNGGESSIVLKSAANPTSDYGFIRYHDHEPLGNHTGTVENSLLEMGTQNDSSAGTGDQIAFSTVGVRRLYIQGDGLVGIGTTTPNARLHVSESAQHIAHFASTFAGQNYISVSRPGQSTLNLEAGSTTYGGSIRSSHELRLLAGDQTVTGRNALIIKDPDGTNTETLLVGRGSSQSSIKSNSDNGGYLMIDSSGNMLGLNFYSGKNILIANGGGKVGIGATGNRTPSASLEVVGDISASGDIGSQGGSHAFYTSTVSSRTKYSVYAKSVYGIGMEDNVTYGGIDDDFAMTFQFNNNDSRGFWFGDDGHTKAQGAMALTTDGRIVLASSMKVGYGESHTSNTSAYSFTTGTNGTGRAIQAQGAIDSECGNGFGAYTIDRRKDFGLIGNAFHATLQAPGDITMAIDSNGNGSTSQFSITSRVSASTMISSSTAELGDELFSCHQNGLVQVKSGSLAVGAPFAVSADIYQADGNGGAPLILIASRFQGDNTTDATNGGGIRFKDNDTDEYYDQAFINGRLMFSHRPGSNGNAAKIFMVTSTGHIDTFTGQHYNLPSSGQISDYNNKVGHIVISTGIYKNVNPDVSENTPTINEALPKVKLSDGPNDKKVFGVISNAEDENGTREHKFGNLVTWDKVKTNNRLIINSLGEGAIMVCNINGNLENGDYITTSHIEGIGMKQDDDLLHNYTVAKITQDENFTSETTDITHNSQTYKMKLVGCTYHCG